MLEQQFQGRQEASKLLTVSTIYPTSSLYFVAYVQPPLNFMYLIFAIFIVFIFIRNNMICFVTVVLVLSNLISIIPMVLTSPFNIVFFILMDKDIPMPFPWCYIFFHLDSSIKAMASSTSLCLKIILGINRVCSVYWPFQTKIWFNKRRCIIYCVATCSVCITVSVLLNFSYQQLIVKPHFDDLWGSMTTYDACSMAPSLSQGDQGLPIHVYVSNLFLVSFYIFGMLCLVVCNIMLILKFRKINLQRKKLSEGRTKHQKDTDARIYLLNTISKWVITAAIFTEIPSLISKSLSLYGFIHIAYYGADEATMNIGIHKVSQHVILLFFYVEQVILAPLDLFVFVILSKKARNAIKSCLCSCLLKE